MIKKIISFTVIFSLITPILSFSLDKEEFLKFLINSSYPEVNQSEKSSEDDKNNNIEENKSNDKQTYKTESTNDKETSKTKEDEFIKVHIGKENVPQVSNNQENTNTDDKSVESNSLVASNYTNNIRVTKENPKIFLYHTHSSETYSNSPKGNFHSNDIDNSVMRIGKELTNELEKRDWGVLHNITYHDAPDYNRSYINSLNTIKETLSKNKSVEIAIDIHRDARILETKKQIEEEKERMVTTINGEKVAKFFFVVGPDNKNVDEIRKIAKDLTNLANKKYPGIALPVIEKEYGKFNQYLAKNHMLIEMGSNGTSTEEVLNSTKYVAEILDEYFKKYK